MRGWEPELIQGHDMGRWVKVGKLGRTGRVLPLGDKWTGSVHYIDGPTDHKTFDSVAKAKAWVDRRL